MWEGSIASNWSAVEVAPGMMHGYDFIIYAYLQLAQDGKAKAAAEKAAAGVRDKIDFVGSPLGVDTAIASIPARLVLETADWKGAAALPIVETRFPAANSLNRFARGLGMARSGNAAGAKDEIQAIKQIRSELEKAGDSYWASRSEEHMLAISAWIAYGEGNREQALKFMRTAADLEDGRVKHVAMENEIYPMRELLAELLLETGQTVAALNEFETSLKSTPNRYRGLWGAARAADAAGDRTKAAGYFAKVVELTRNADTPRPEIALARGQVAQR